MKIIPLTKSLLAAILAYSASACSQSPRQFSSVEVGMSNEQVLEYAGEPDKKQSIGVADLWVYEKADRTVVFRKDTVYDIITSAHARIDSIKTSLDVIGDTVEHQAEKAGAKIKEEAEKAGVKLDSLGNRIFKKKPTDSKKDN